MEIKQLKASFQLAKLRADSDPSESNLAILQSAKEAYEIALDPEKKTEGPSHEGEDDTKTKPAAKPKNQPLAVPSQETSPASQPQTQPVTEAG